MSRTQPDVRRYCGKNRLQGKASALPFVFGVTVPGRSKIVGRPDIPNEHEDDSGQDRCDQRLLGEARKHGRAWLGALNDLPVLRLTADPERQGHEQNRPPDHEINGETASNGHGLILSRAEAVISWQASGIAARFLAAAAPRNPRESL